MMDPRGARRVSPHAVLTDYYTDAAQQRRFLTKLFDDTAPFYDHINALMSLGSGAWYRRWVLRRAGLIAGASVLDVAVGTGEVARAALTIVGASGRVVGVDPSAGMLARARGKLRIPLARGVAEQLPFRDGAFDFLSMGYALRHVADLRQLFREYHRVLRPGGTVLVLDFARPRSRLGHALGRFYLDGVVPWLSRLRYGGRAGQLLVRYCWDTLEALVPRETIVAAMAGSGFEDAGSVLRFGVLSEYVGRKPRASRP
jgi:demethylmenaquinone methyltransferase/2-methoxy-6-polyprenyl-1,4-benzoquinol methylase